MARIWWLVVLVATVGLAGCERSESLEQAADRASQAERNGSVDAEPQTEQLAVGPQDVDPAAFHRWGVAEPRPRTPGTIRIATYNVENLFDDVDDPALSGRFEDIDDTKPASECQAVAEAVHRIDADVLAVEEIESREALIAFRDEYLSDMGYEHVVSLDAGDERGIEQAVLSRFPIVDHRQWIRRPLGGIHPDKYGSQENWYAGEEIVFHRSPLMVEVEVPGDVTGGDAYRLTLIVVHHKSGRYSSYWREAEVRGTLEVIAELMAENPDRNVVILGDFNAQTTDESVKMYLDAGFGDIVGERSGPEWVTHASGRRIDLILANEQAMREIKPESAFVLGTTAGPEGMDWQEAHLLPGYASDHYPVVVDLTPRD
ncbi:MAG: hypothetical protein D6695_02525 [Planctomycetota bacterium]|nr:MAG: hypothetical protein D6695_02525 [Planctomycetota bacterium]